MIWQVRAWWQRGVNWFIPTRCLSCHEILEGSSGGLCSTCWVAVHFISDPLCTLCGVPFEFEVNADLKCLTCLDQPPLFKKARAPLLYEGKQRDLVLRFKHADATHMAPVFSHWMTRAGADFLKECQAVVPVPLHWSRLLRRRYNQAALLAKGVAVKARCPYWPTLLKRVRATPMQGQKNRQQRQHNMKGAFALNSDYKGKIVGASLCLVDDVLTSGATVSECVQVLKEAGASQVFVLTLARVSLT